MSLSQRCDTATLAGLLVIIDEILDKMEPRQNGQMEPPVEQTTQHSRLESTINLEAHINRQMPSTSDNNMQQTNNNNDAMELTSEQAAMTLVQTNGHESNGHSDTGDECEIIGEVSNGNSINSTNGCPPVRPAPDQDKQRDIAEEEALIFQSTIQSIIQDLIVAAND